MIDLVAFHQNLLGINQEQTPVEYRLTKAQERLYAASQESARRGFLLSSNASSLESWEHFLATFILAYGQTPEGPVAFAVSAPTLKWASQQVTKIATRIFRARAKAPKDTIHNLYSNFQNLTMGSAVLQVNEPARWVAYGFTDADVLPPWMRNRLLSAGNAG